MKTDLQDDLKNIFKSTAGLGLGIAAIGTAASAFNNAAPLPGINVPVMDFLGFAF